MTQFTKIFNSYKMVLTHSQGLFMSCKKLCVVICVSDKNNELTKKPQEQRANQQGGDSSTYYVSSGSAPNLDVSSHLVKKFYP